MSRLSVLIVDDHALFRAGVRSLCQGFRNVDVVGEAANGNEALRLIPQLAPSVVLMDITMPGLNGIDATKRAAKKHPRTRILMLSMHSDKEYVQQSLVAGAAGYVVKTAPPEELELALHAVNRGELWLSPSVSRGVLDALVRGRTTSAAGELTPRQREILQLIAEGHSTKEIGLRLQISAKTVESHRAQIMDRLDVRHVAGLVRHAIRAGLIGREV